MSEKLKIELTATLSNGPRNSTIIEIEKCDYDEAENIMVYKLKPANGSLMFEPVNT